MASRNLVILIGNLGDAPTVRFAPNGSAVANFRIAISETWKDKEGVKQERTEWVSIVAFGKLAEICGEYLKKGSQIYVEGKLQTRQWEDKDKNKRYTTEVVASVMQMLGAKEKGSAPEFAAGVPSDVSEDTIPF